jgi:predicted dehydrogenase
MPKYRSMTRRGFLKRSAAVSAAAMVPSIVPGSALGAESKAAPSERIAVGMIGVGRQAYIVNLGRQFLKMPDVQIVALCDVDRWRLNEGKKLVEDSYAKQQSAGKYTGCPTYDDFHEVLDRDDIDAVMISTPDHWHTPMAIAAAKAGKHVSLEKPITRTVAEGQAIIDAMREHKRVFRVDSEMRSQQSFLRMAELVRNGRVGKIKAVRVGVPAGDNVDCPSTPDMPVPEGLNYEMWQGPAPRAPYTQERVHPPKQFGRPGWMRVLYYCDGMITNWGTHFCDVAQWCFGTERTGPVEIEGHGVWPPSGKLWNVLKTFEVTYRFADGTPFYYENTRNPDVSGALGPCSAYVKFEGTEGWIYGAFGGPAELRFKSEPGSILTSKIGPDEIRFPLKSDKQDFIDAVKAGGRTLEDEEVGHRTTSLCHLGHIAIHLDQKLKWDPDKERFIHNDAANAYLNKPIHAPPNA